MTDPTLAVDTERLAKLAGTLSARAAALTDLARRPLLDPIEAGLPGSAVGAVASAFAPRLAEAGVRLANRVTEFGAGAGSSANGYSGTDAAASGMIERNGPR